MAKKTLLRIEPEIKKIIFWIVFIILWILTFLIDKSKYLWYYYIKFLNILFWNYYIMIFWIILLVFWTYLLINKYIKFNIYRILWLFFYFLSFSTFIWFFDKTNIAFFNISENISKLLWEASILLFSILLFIASIIILFNLSLFKVFNLLLKLLKSIFISIKNDSKNLKEKIKENYKEERIKEKEIQNIRKKEEYENMIKELQEEKIKIEKSKKSWIQLSIDDMPKKISIEKTNSIWKLFIETKNKLEINKNQDSNTQTTDQNTNNYFSNWKLPDLKLLKERWWNIVFDPKEIRKKEIEIQEKLLQFKIEVDMVWYQVWPTVIQFRLKPHAWIAIKKIVNLKNDLTLALHAKSIRIQAPIPWLWVVWIEVPNDNRQVVWLKELIWNSEFNNKKIAIPIAVWKNVSWNIIIWDLTKMPHLLIAGQTWAWKSVWMNWFLISILYKFSPSELKFIMIDPKRVELSVYNWIPHLLTPVITNPDKALNSLKWCVAEMLRRYDLSAQARARNFDEYNNKVDKSQKWPYIVIVIDELADLMMSWSKKEVEWSIQRISQMARAVWMHLIVATQRPSIDVITWIIKANIPSRIAFTVASQIDSQTILQGKWAEDLLGRWDMLYYPTWLLEAERVQWVLVETEEVEAIVNQLKLTIDSNFLSNLQDKSISEWISKSVDTFVSWNWDQWEDWEIINKAIEIVKQAKKWSTSLIQRKLWLWYARAAKILDILEEMWVVWPANWSKPRDVYID